MLLRFLQKQKESKWETLKEEKIVELEKAMAFNFY
jgi:hypothetical protein